MKRVMDYRKIGRIAGALLIAAALFAAVPPWQNGVLCAAGLLLLGFLQPAKGALTYFVPLLGTGVYYALASFGRSGEPVAAFPSDLGTMLLCVCLILGIWAMARKTQPGFDCVEAIGIFAIIMLGCQADAMQKAVQAWLNPAMGQMFTGTALAWYRTLYGVLLIPFLRKGSRESRFWDLLMLGSCAALYILHAVLTYQYAEPGTVLHWLKMRLLASDILLPALALGGLWRAWPARRA